jgi:hypothetical protein
VFTSHLDDDSEPEDLAECDVGEFFSLAFFHSSIDWKLGAGQYPTLMRLLDSDGGSPASEVRALEREIQEIAAAFRKLPSDRMTIAFERVQEARAAEARVAKGGSERPIQLALQMRSKHDHRPTRQQDVIPVFSGRTRTDRAAPSRNCSRISQIAVGRK